MLRAASATDSGWCRTAPSTCQRAAVSPLPAVMRSATSKSAPFRRNTFSTSSVSASPAGLRSRVGFEGLGEGEVAGRVMRLEERVPRIQGGRWEHAQPREQEARKLE
jgi:hypothetical protein